MLKISLMALIQFECFTFFLRNEHEYDSSELMSYFVQQIQDFQQLR